MNQDIKVGIVSVVTLFYFIWSLFYCIVFFNGFQWWTIPAIITFEIVSTVLVVFITSFLLIFIKD